MIMGRIIRIGTRESQLAIWQSTQVKQLLAGNGFDSELVTIKSEGDIDLVTPLYEIGVQGIFTRSLDAALLNDRIDIAVHSMKDVPVQLAKVRTKIYLCLILILTTNKEHLSFHEFLKGRDNHRR